MNARATLSTLVAALSMTAFAKPPGQGQPAPPVRHPLLEAAVAPVVQVAAVKAFRIVFAPGQAAGIHIHPVPVVGIVTKGSFVLQVEGEESRLITPGGAFFEPAGRRILRFDNASPTIGAEISAFYLLDSPDTPLVRPAPPAH